MYKYERSKKILRPESYSFDYSRVYDTNRLYVSGGEGRRFSHFEKEKKHLEKPKRNKTYRFAKIEKPQKFKHVEKYQNGAGVFSGLFRFMFACVFLTAFLAAFAIAVSVFDKGDEAWNLKNYDDMIWPVVMQDPKPFDESNPPDKETMLKASLWKLAMNRNNMNESWNEKSQLVLPKSDVESAGKKLFGKEPDFSGLTQKGSGFYKFDDSKNAFLVEPISGTDGFLPHTVNACHEGDDVVLKVGYVSPKNQFNSEMNKVFNNKVEKYAKYRLKKNINTGNFYILSVN